MKILPLLMFLLLVLNCSDSSNFTTTRPKTKPRIVPTSTSAEIDDSEIDNGSNFPGNNEDLLNDPLLENTGTTLPLGDCLGNPKIADQSQHMENGHTNIFLVQNQEASFCQLLVSSGKDTALLQYIPSDCTDCEQEIQNISWAIQRSAYSNLMTHIIVLKENNPVLVDQISSYLTDKSVQAKLVIDEKQEFNGEIAQKKLLSETPQLITVNAHLEYEYISLIEPLYLKIVPAAEAMHLAVTGSEILPEKLPKGNWDGEAHKTTGLLDIISITQFDAAGGL